MKYKLIASDLDETLLNDQKHVDAKTCQAILQARKQGVIFVPCTGRGFTLIRRTLRELNLLNAQNEYVISFNGSVVTENYQEQVIQQVLMNYDTINTLFEIGIRNHLAMHVYTLRDVFVYNMNADENDYLSRLGFQYHTLAQPSISLLQDQPMEKILYMNKDRSELDDVRSQIPSDLLAQLTVTYSSNRYMEFNPLGINKGQGLLQLLQHLHIKPEETIAIGDSFNDIEMLKVAGLGVAVKNAVPEVKDVANYVTNNDYNHDAVAEVIKKFVLD